MRLPRYEAVCRGASSPVASPTWSAWDGARCGASHQDLYQPVPRGLPTSDSCVRASTPADKRRNFSDNKNEDPTDSKFAFLIVAVGPVGLGVLTEHTHTRSGVTPRCTGSTNVDTRCAAGAYSTSPRSHSSAELLAQSPRMASPQPPSFTNVRQRSCGSTPRSAHPQVPSPRFVCSWRRPDGPRRERAGCQPAAARTLPRLCWRAEEPAVVARERRRRELVACRRHLRWRNTRTTGPTESGYRTQTTSQLRRSWKMRADLALWASESWRRRTKPRKKRFGGTGRRSRRLFPRPARTSRSSGTATRQKRRPAAATPWQQEEHPGVGGG